MSDDLTILGKPVMEPIRKLETFPAPDDVQVVSLTSNDVLPNPTAENLAIYLLGQVPYCRQVRVWESDHAYAEVSSE